MPVILERQDWPMWLGEAAGDHAALLRVWPVDRRIGSPRNNGPELLESIAA
jgi:putative SOS response-associated peptidase YedK